MINLMRASARTSISKRRVRRSTLLYETHPCVSRFGPTASPSFKFAPSEFSLCLPKRKKAKKKAPC
jgi:hypothetical protein